MTIVAVVIGFILKTTVFINVTLKYSFYIFVMVSSYNMGGAVIYAIRRFGVSNLVILKSDAFLKDIVSLAIGHAALSFLIFFILSVQQASVFSYSIALGMPVILQVLVICFAFRRGGKISSANENYSAGGIEQYLFNVKIIKRFIEKICGYFYGSFKTGKIFFALDLFIAALISFSVVSSVLPQIAWDSMAYQLEIPKRYIAAGGMHFIADIHFSGHPQMINMIYSVFIMFGEDTLTGLFHASFLLMSVLFIAGFPFFKIFGYFEFQRYFKRGLVLLILTHPQIMIISSWAYIDLALMFYVSASFLFLMSEEFFLSCVLLGAALCIKYTAMMFMPLFALAAFYVVNGDWRKKLDTALRFILIALFLFSPYMLKNFYYTGNPLYPFFASYIPYETFTYDYMSAYLATLDLVGRGRSFADLIRYPYDSMIYSRFHGNRYFDGLMGVTFFFLIPFFLFTIYKLAAAKFDDKHRKAYVCAAVVFFSYYIFVLKAQSTRFFIPIAPLFYMLSLIGLKSLFDILSQKTRRLALAIGMAILFCNVWPALVVFKNNFPSSYLLAGESKEQYLARNFPPYMCIALYNNIYEKYPDSKLMSMYEPRLYYINSGYLWRDVFEASELEIFIHELIDSQPTISIKKAIPIIIEKMKASAITHILVSNKALKISSSNFDNVKKEELFNEFLSERANLLFAASGYNLYEIRR